jgi:hypothetical protein
MFGLKACVLAAGLLLAPAASSSVAVNTANGTKPDNQKAKKKGAKKADQTAALFKKLDANNDGKLSQTEFAKLNDAQTALKANNAKKANKPAKANKANKAAKGKKANATAALFKKLDANNDGSLTAAEFGKLKEAQKALQAANPKKKNKK